MAATILLLNRHQSSSSSSSSSQPLLKFAILICSGDVKDGSVRKAAGLPPLLLATPLSCPPNANPFSLDPRLDPEDGDDEGDKSGKKTSGALFTAEPAASSPNALLPLLHDSSPLTTTTTTTTTTTNNSSTTIAATVTTATTAATTTATATATSPIRVLHIAGSADPLVPLADCRALADSLNVDGDADVFACSFHVVEGGGHGLPPNRDLALIRNFVDSAMVV